MTAAKSACAFRCGSDEFGVFAQSSVDPNIFSETAILKTAYWFTDQHYVFLAKNLETGLIDVEFRLKGGENPEALKLACGDFANHLLDQEVRQKVLTETATVRDALVKKAFMDARTPLPFGTMCGESSRPTANQSYVEDPVGIGHIR